MLRSRRIEIVSHPPSAAFEPDGWTSEVVTRAQSLLAVNVNEGGGAVAHYGPSFALGAIATGPTITNRGIDGVIPSSIANRTRIKELKSLAATASKDLCIIGSVDGEQVAERTVACELPFGVRLPFFRARFAVAEKMVKFKVIQKSFELEKL